MSLDKFLDFWSNHNQTIIQALIVLTLIFIVALVFITLFGSKEEVSATQVGISPDLEKSLQKLLENQTKAAVFDFSKNPDAAAPSTAATTEGSAAINAEAAAQVEKLKAEMAQKEKKIQDLNTQLSQAVSTAAAGAAADSSGLESRIKELEARLAEYDIISEDIADLSRYKDENEKLKAELSGLRSVAVAPAATPVAAAPPPVSAPVAAPAPVVTAAPAQPAAPAPAPEPVVDPAGGQIDDDLMKEFAAAVEGQKAATQGATAGAPAPSAQPVSPDGEDLMGQFENFVAKKEGS